MKRYWMLSIAWMSIATSVLAVEIETNLNVPYDAMAPTDPLRQLDIYAPKGLSGCPVMLYVHGGGWDSGDKAAVYAKPEFFCKNGWVFVSVNYRLYPESWQTEANDVARAIAWVLQQIQSYGGDPNSFYLMGHSAGCHLASLVATDGQYLAAHNLGLDRISAVIALDTKAYNLPWLAESNGGTLPTLHETIFGSNPTNWPLASPALRVQPGQNTPPFAIAFSGGDSGGLAPDRQLAAEMFAAALEAAGTSAIVIDGQPKTHAEINNQFGEVGDWVTEDAWAMIGEVQGRCFELTFEHNQPLAQGSVLLDAYDHGILDILVAAKNKVHLIRNLGGSSYQHASSLVVDGANGWGAHDFDADGRLDAFVAQAEEGRKDVLRNRGDGIFPSFNLGNETRGRTRNVLFADFDGNGVIDSYHSVSAFDTNHFGNEFHAGISGTSFGPDSVETILNPPITNFWYKWANLPDGTQEYWANKMFKGAFTRDLDKDGKTDIVTGAYADLGYGDPRFATFARDWVENQDRGVFILHNNSTPGSFRFTEVAKQAIGPYAYGSSYSDWNVYAITPIDYDRDGDFDLFVGTKIRNINGVAEDTRAVGFFENVSTPGTIQFVDRTVEAGFGAFNTVDPATRAMRSFAACAPIDYDNDGWVDLCTINRVDLDRTWYPYPHLFRNQGDGTFVEIRPADTGLNTGSGGRDLNYGDINNDGRLDLIIHDGTVGGYDGFDNSRIYENRVVNDNHYIRVNVSGVGNTFGIGTTVYVYEASTGTLIGYDEVRTDFCYRSKRYPVLHFGVGVATSVDIRLVGPNGQVIRYDDLGVDTLHTFGLPTNVAPVAADQVVNLLEDGFAGTTLAATDANEDALSYTIGTGPLHGTLSGSAPNLTYTPSPNYNGSDSFTFIVDDGKGGTDSGLVTIAVAAVNDAPSISSYTATPTNGYAPLNVQFQAVATDIDGGPLSFTWIFGDGTSGNGATVTHSYATGGAYTATLTVTDGNGGSASATVGVTVINPDPVLTVTNGLIFHLAADDIDGDGQSANNPPDGASVSNWNDKSPNGFDMDNLLNAAPTYRSNVLNGRGVVEFDGVDDGLKMDELLQPSAFTVFLVARQADGGARGRVLSSATRNWLFGYWGGKDRAWYFSGGPYNRGTVNTQWHLHAGTMSSDDKVNFWADGVQVDINNTSAAATPSNTPGQMTLGGVGIYRERSHCQVAEVIMFNRVLTDVERNTVGDYLKTKYGL